MSWRTVVVSTRCKLDLKMGYMVIRGEETKRVFLDEIALVMIENPAVSLTGCLLEALTEKKIKIIFCDRQRSPMAELVPYAGCHDSSRKLRSQLAWEAAVKGAVWREIVREKIGKQAQLLAECKKQQEALLLESYLPQVELFDATNREGHAAKVYFNSLFGKQFTRDAKIPVNAALDYGYSIILSAFNREIAASGYLMQLGIHHDNVFNHFNMSCDLMEPFRILVDRVVREMPLESFGKDERYRLVNILNTYIEIGDTEQTVLNAIGIYVRSVLEAMNTGNLQQICWYRV